jgi:hypothetical protein
MMNFIIGYFNEKYLMQSNIFLKEKPESNIIIFPTLMYKTLMKGELFAHEIHFELVGDIVKSFSRNLEISQNGEITEIYIPIYFPHYEYAMVFIEVPSKTIYYF